MTDSGASLDLLMAWAILRAMPGKERRLRDIVTGRDVLDGDGRQHRLGLGWPIWEPMHQASLIEAPAPMFPGYLFVRPPTGQRRHMRQLPYCAGPLEIVISDRYRVWTEAVEQTQRRALQADAERKRVVRAQRVVRCFTDLGTVLGLDQGAMPVDSESGQAHVSGSTEHDSVRLIARLAAYERTDDDADEASLGAEAMVRLKKYFT